MIENYQSLERVYELDQDSDLPTYKFKQGHGKISFFSRADQEREENTPYLQINPEGMLYHSFAPSRPMPILEQLRKDSKDPKLKKSIEKLLATTQEKHDTTHDKKSSVRTPKPMSTKRKTQEVTTRL